MHSIKIHKANITVVYYSFVLLDDVGTNLYDAILIKNEKMFYNRKNIEGTYFTTKKEKRYFEPSKLEPKRQTSKGDTIDAYAQHIFDQHKPFMESNYLRR